MFLALNIALSLSSPAPTLAVGGLLVATYESKKWVVHPSTLPKWKRVRFQEVKIGSLGKSVVIPGAVIAEMSGQPYLQATNGKWLGVLWSGAAPAFPRPVRLGGTLSSTSRETLRGLMPKDIQGKAGLRLVKTVSGDFDGDGKADKLVECLGVTKEGKKLWSAVVLFQAGKKPVVLESDALKEEQVGTLEIGAVADMDRDGALDVVLSNFYLEGNGGSVWSLRKGGPMCLVTNGS